MEEDRTPRISLKYTASDYKTLYLNLNSDDQTWRKAIAIFEDRFNERFFEPIKMLSHNPKQYGFSIMALNCLLIDTFIQFNEGVDEIPTHNQKKWYANFLINNFPDIFTSEKIANRFYKDIRCGILHSAQTKNGSRLAVDIDRAVDFRKFPPNNPYICVNVIDFTELLNNYFQNYIDKLMNNDTTTRKHFIEKMNYIVSDMERG